MKYKTEEGRIRNEQNKNLMSSIKKVSYTEELAKDADLNTYTVKNYFKGSTKNIGDQKTKVIFQTFEKRAKSIIERGRQMGY